MRLLRRGSTADNELSGRWLDSTYLGGAAQHRVELSEKMTIRLDELKPELNAESSADAEVRIGFDAADVVVLTG
jgi:hypothetical protein